MRPLIGTSVKMNLTATEITAWCAAVRPAVSDLPGVDLFLLPAFPAIQAARDGLAGSRFAWGAQDVHPDDAGAHTGDVSAPMLVDLGCRYVETGHSERRRDHAETDGLIAAKVAAILRHGMTPILCVGEAAPGPVDVAGAAVADQVAADLAQIAPDELAQVVVAYEPVWAIGVGALPAAPAHIAGVHAAIRAALIGLGPGGALVRVIYGGSVDPTTARGILEQPGVDGLFVGRAALDPSRFIQIAVTASELASERVERAIAG